MNGLIFQNNPQLGAVELNISRARQALFPRYQLKAGLDFILFPEMSFTGYNLKKQQIKKVATKAGEGASFQFCREVALALKTHVIFGYPQTTQQVQNQIFYNSASVIEPSGKLIHNYRKTHLYEEDKFWAKEGQGFSTFTLKTSRGEFKCSLGICMDLNPYQFTSGLFEFGDFCFKNQVQLIFALNNWIDHQPENPNQQNSLLAIINYWLFRLTPALKSAKLLVLANRAGAQEALSSGKLTPFMGGSCCVKLGKQPQLLSMCNKKNQMVLNVEVNLDY